MALTPEQENLIEFNLAQAAANTANESKTRRLEAIRIAKETLLENARSKPVDARDVSAADITAFADSLIQYINQ